MANKQLNSRKIFLRATLKIFIAITLISLIYIFTSGFFRSPDSDKADKYEFDISALRNNNGIYFKANRRELLVVKHRGKPEVFWAQDPVYGCRLELINKKIKPVCINIEYDLNGVSQDKQQQLLTPQYNITSQNKLIVY